MRSRSNIQLKAIAALTCGMVFFVIGCKTLSQIAPPADERLVRVSGTALPALERGRGIYLNQYIKCHVAEPVHDYSQQQWARILPQMIKLSKLSPEQGAEVKAYIAACLAVGSGEEK